MAFMLVMAVMGAKAQSGRILVAVYSKTGNTMAVAQNIVELTGADLIEIIPAVPYPESYSETLPIATQEINNIDQYGIYPEILTTIESMDEYETVIVCAPIWSMSVPAASLLCGIFWKNASPPRCRVSCIPTAR